MKKTIAVLSLAVLLMTASTQAMADNVFVTAKGKKYHKETCTLVKNKAKTAVDLVDAEGKGLTPCKKCFKAEQVAKAEINQQ